MKTTFKFLLIAILSVMSLSFNQTNASELEMQDWRTEYAPTPKEKYKVDVDLVKDYGAVSDGSREVSEELQCAIDDVSAKGGGRLFVPAGEYRIANIEMRSGVKLHIDHRATFRPELDAKNSKVFMFSFSGGDKWLEDVEVRGIGGRFTIALKKTENEKSTSVFTFRAVRRFAVTNVHIEDVKMRHPLMTFGATLTGELMLPTDGVISYCSNDNSHYGYGLVQMQSAKRVHFEKLSGIGGVTLRAETGAAEINDLQRGELTEITARYLHCKDGNAPFMVSPHSMHNGDITAEEIYADGCGFAARIHVGFISEKQTRSGLTRGTFKMVTVRNISAIAGDKAQIKTKHQKYMPVSLLDECPKPGTNGICEPAPSIAAVLDEANYPVTIENIKAEGFINPDIVRQTDEQRAAAERNSAAAAKAINERAARGESKSIRKSEKKAKN